mmetsp:Transcript_12687/g.26998  ORF Transcript_12687/g.26998 Transcript_12687/m.26998 type:complete len:328 (+) Transcript_12687:148-1131(+)|eukprot:CAMPEP_0183733376 /NCGR_PEP_ID=MMETSP0737-20130205/40993_1 /TAXON_ID=385413 /ORGANISM="Thalassiosira miniscula, Strain CCMP1093" /LENGTH=327 /DNA_ID=CAMNT_0025966617 /DNA_START=71 /DNA_END=1054 /DNA_ORIENTATION=-
MPTTIALFGATGNVGKELVNSLRNAFGDFDYLVFSRSGNTTTDAPFESVTLPTKDNQTDQDELADILKSKGVETCFLLIPQLQVAYAKKFVEDNYLSAFKSAGVKRVVKVSTGNAEKYEYGRRHIAAEDAIREAGLNLTVFRAGDFSTNPHWLGPAPPGAPYVLIDIFKGMSYLSYVGIGMFRSMGNLGSFIGSDIDVPFMHLADFGDAIASCLMNAAEHENKTYTIYSDKVTFNDVANIYSDLLGRKIHVLEMSDDEIKGLIAMDGYKGELADICVEMFHKFREGAFMTDDTWDGFQTLCPGKTPRKFKDFAKEKVDAGFKPLKLW